jgi:competence protein ComEC
MGYLDLRDVTGAGGLRATARGRILVFFPADSLPRLRDFGRGAKVFVEGSFAETSGGVSSGSSLFRAQAVHIVRSPPAWEQLRTGIRLTLLKKLEHHIWGGLGAALLLGVKDTLDNEFARKYQAAGCSHVLALSGMHLAIVAAIAAFFLRKPLGLKMASVAGAVFILLYVTLIGVQPSLERSAIMYLLGTIAVLGFLPQQPLSLLSIAFLVQLLIRPSAGTSLSFILSYLALIGILTVGEFLHGILRGRLPELLASPLAASLGAYMATSAVVAAGFGVIRPVGILAGLIIVPLTTVFMIGAMAALAISFISPFLTAIAGRGLTLFYSLLDRTVSLAALAPALSAGWMWELLLSLAVAVLCLFPGRQYSVRRQYLAPFP